MRDGAKIYLWRRKGEKLPPPHILKQHTINKYRKKYMVKILVESGTYLGQMVDAMRYRFKKIKSIELSKELYEKAVEKFKPYHHIKLYLGDSSSIIPHVIEVLHEPAIFWLDGHFSAGITAKGKLSTPIVEELTSIATSNLAHIILIDDARLFTGADDYPDMGTMNTLISAQFPLHKMEIKDDIIRILPKQ
jgi:hypothetical protein